MHLLFFKYLNVDRICALRVWAGGPQTSGLPLADVQMVSIVEAVRDDVWLGPIIQKVHCGVIKGGC